jgi:multicomponent Na+:H+ antiporter subunit E
MNLIRPLLAIVVLTGAWVLLWGRLSVGTVIGGVLVSFAAYRATRLPPASGLGRVRPVPAAVALADVARELVLSSVVIGWHALRHPDDSRGALVAVPTRAESDAVLALVSSVVSVTPGTLVVGFDRANSLLYVHGLPAHDRAAAEALRRRVAKVDARVTRAFESRRVSSRQGSSNT